LICLNDKRISEWINGLGRRIPIYACHSTGILPFWAFPTE
jgi:hypothetical protein